MSVKFSDYQPLTLAECTEARVRMDRIIKEESGVEPAVDIRTWLQLMMELN